MSSLNDLFLFSFLYGDRCVFSGFNDVLGHAQGVGRDGQRGVDASAGGEKGAVDHVKIFHPMGAIEPVHDAGAGILPHSAGSTGVSQ